MPFADLPRYAAWQHRESRSGFEVVFLHAEPICLAEGHTAAVEAEEAWAVHYVIALDERGTTRRAGVTGHSPAGRNGRELQADGAGRWWIDGQPAPQLDGCLDVDLESSCLTNAFPVNRLALEIGQTAEAPAAYVRAPHLRVERLEQRYTRLDDAPRGHRYHYEAPVFGFECELVYDRSALVLDYPGIGRRLA